MVFCFVSLARVANFFFFRELALCFIAFVYCFLFSSLLSYGLSLLFCLAGLSDIALSGEGGGVRSLYCQARSKSRFPSWGGWLPLCCGVGTGHCGGGGLVSSWWGQKSWVPEWPSDAAPVTVLRSLITVLWPARQGPRGLCSCWVGRGHSCLYAVELEVEQLLSKNFVLPGCPSLVSKLEEAGFCWGCSVCTHGYFLVSGLFISESRVWGKKETQGIQGHVAPWVPESQPVSFLLSTFRSLRFSVILNRKNRASRSTPYSWSGSSPNYFTRSNWFGFGHMKTEHYNIKWDPNFTIKSLYREFLYNWAFLFSSSILMAIRMPLQ